MKRAEYTPLAESDVTEVWTFIASDSIEAADRFVESLRRKCQSLARSPGMGRARPEFGRDYRCFPYRGYLIFYRPAPCGIEIARIVSGYRNLARLFESS